MPSDVLECFVIEPFESVPVVTLHPVFTVRIVDEGDLLVSKRTVSWSTKSAGCGNRLVDRWVESWLRWLSWRYRSCGVVASTAAFSVRLAETFVSTGGKGSDVAHLIVSERRIQAA